MKKLIHAWLDAGPRPDIHEEAKQELKEKWPSLYEGIEELVMQYKNKMLIIPDRCNFDFENACGHHRAFISKRETFARDSYGNSYSVATSIYCMDCRKTISIV